MLISEISQSAALDQLEIVNLGPASIDISCLEVVRYAIGGIYTETLPMVSMGGSSMIFTSIAMGIILSVSQEVNQDKQEMEGSQVKHINRI